MLVHQKQHIIALFQQAIASLLTDAESAPPAVTLERPRDPAHGDVACNIAMQLAKPLKKNPRELAQALVTALLANPARAGLIDSAEIAGPGFINLRLSAAARQAVVDAVRQQGAQYGQGTAGAGKKVMVEFVSANPTGPLHVGHGRQAALGDAMAALLQSQGYDVTREFYYNDAGVQIANLALSVQARATRLQAGRRRVAGVGLQRRLHRRHRRRLPGAEDRLRQRWRAGDRQRRRRRPGIDPQIRRDLSAPRAGPGPAGLRRQVRQLLPGIVAVRRRQGRRHGRGAGRGRPYLRGGRRAVAAHHRLRRRQGPGDEEVRRHLHLLRAGRRLPRQQMAARLRPGDQRPGQRPPRHHRPRARRPAGARHRHPARLSGLRAAQDGDGDEERRGSEDFQARRLLRHLARPDRMVGRRRCGDAI